MIQISDNKAMNLFPIIYSHKTYLKMSLGF